MTDPKSLFKQCVRPKKSNFAHSFTCRIFYVTLSGFQNYAVKQECPNKLKHLLTQIGANSSNILNIHFADKTQNTVMFYFANRHLRNQFASSLSYFINRYYNKQMRIV